MKEEIPLSVIVPVYNGEKTLAACLESVYGSEYRHFEVIVVDDGSSDQTRSVISRFPCKVIRLDENRGAATARNTGAAASRGDVLFFLDADISIEKDTLSRIVATFQSKPAISAMFCSYQPATGPTNFFSVYKNLMHHHTHQTSNEEAATFCGGFGAIKREVFAAFGGFDERYRILEDMELGYRLSQAGHSIHLNKRIQLTHHKRYTLLSLIHSDLFNRAIPWTKLMLTKRVFRNDLNTKTANVVSVPVALSLFVGLLVVPRWPGAGTVLGGLLAVFLWLNRGFLGFVYRRQGLVFLLKTIVMKWVTDLYSGIGLALGVLAFLRGRVTSHGPATQTSRPGLERPGE